MDTRLYSISKAPRCAPEELPPAADRWIAARLDAAGFAQDALSTQRVHWYPWSAVWRIETAGGPVYFKACAASQAHEPALVEALDDWLPHTTTPPIAADAEHGWLLLRDGGQTLRQHLDGLAGDTLLYETQRHWRPVLRQLGMLQAELAARSDHLLAMGVADQRLHRLPQLYLDLLGRPERLVLDFPDKLDVAALSSLRELTPRVEAACRQLSALGLPATLDHGDLWDKHVFWRGGEYRFFDWGDASVTHPFLTLTAPLGSIAVRLPDGLQDGRMQPLLDEYLAPWREFAPLPDLRQAAWLACRLGALTRALNWERALGDHVNDLSPELRELYAAGLSYWLKRLQSEL